MAVIDGSSTFGILIIQLNAMTGSLFLSLLFIMLLLFGLCFGFRLPIEFSAIIMMPLLLVSLLASTTTQFYGVLAVIIIYLSAMIAKYFFFN